MSADKEQASRPVCKLTECQGKPRCRMCLAMDARYTAPPAESERIAALEAERDDFHMKYRAKCDEETKAQAMRIASLEAENAALRADAERWRYVVTHASWYRHDDGRDRYSRMCVRLPYEADQSCVATRTAAIDAARNKT